ncbi:MAG: hypothetical protein AAB224_00010 [Gemmatimonadota bacterium]|mgnify:FL=1
MTSSQLAHAPCCAALAAGLLCLSAVAAAQFPKESEDVHARNDCRLAVQTLTKGHPAPKSDWALGIIFTCDQSGGAAVQLLWTTPPTDSVALDELMWASASLLDLRVYLGARSAATNVGAPRAARIAALRVLAAFIEPAKIRFPPRLLLPSSDPNIAVSSDHEPLQLVGSQPLDAAAKADIASVFATLIQSDPDEYVRFAARRLQPRTGD